MIMIVRNDYAKELYNGDVGVVIRDRVGACRALFPRFGSYMAFSMDVLPPWELAFATTVHKSQGSEFDDVLLVLPPDEAHRLLTREIVYTGVTRARKRIIIYGTASVLKNALTRQIERQSGLVWVGPDIPFSFQQFKGLCRDICWHRRNRSRRLRQRSWVPPKSR